jgi:hypothetical protein
VQVIRLGAACHLLDPLDQGSVAGRDSGFVHGWVQLQVREGEALFRTELSPRGGRMRPHTG